MKALRILAAIVFLRLLFFTLPVDISLLMSTFLSTRTTGAKLNRTSRPRLNRQLGFSPPETVASILDGNLVNSQGLVLLSAPRVTVSFEAHLPDEAATNAFGRWPSFQISHGSLRRLDNPGRHSVQWARLRNSDIASPA